MSASTTGQAVRGRGKDPGRPAALSPDQVEQVRQLYAAGGDTVAAIAARSGISRNTVYRALPAGDRRSDPPASRRT